MRSAPQAPKKDRSGDKLPQVTACGVEYGPDVLPEGASDERAISQERESKNYVER
jgi:hypothetical protein